LRERNYLLVLQASDDDTGSNVLGSGERQYFGFRRPTAGGEVGPSRHLDHGVGRKLVGLEFLV
jgi:hypothetical protein